MNAQASILLADTVTKLGPEHAGCVLVGGSHGGRYAGYLAAKAGVRAVILSDAGVGKEQAGIGSLADMDKLGRPAATVAHDSARIGDANDMMTRGRISHVNDAAAKLGCKVGMATADCAETMRAAPAPAAKPEPVSEGRILLRDGPVKVWGLDSASLIAPSDEGQVLICGSHGALLPGGAGKALGADALAAVFHNAGVGIDGCGITRLPALDGRGIVGATVDADSARIGDARSLWETGVLSHVNERAKAIGAAPGMTVQAFVDLVLQNQERAR
ncbi:MAG: hypothetical protein RIM84_04535 [Alphaproteobacteria bacterium]